MIIEFEVWDSIKQVLGVGMLRVVEDLLGLAILDNFPFKHDSDIYQQCSELLKGHVR